MKTKSKKFQGVYVYTGPSRPGDECYYINYRDASGRVRNEKVGWRSEGYTQDQANTVRQDRVHSIRHGKELPGKNGVPSFQEAYDKWIESQENKGIVGVSQIQGIYRKHLESVVGNRKLTEITSDSLNRLTRRLKEDGLRPGTVLNIHYILRAVYKHSGLHGGYQGQNPMVHVVSPKTRGIYRERILSEPEARDLLVSMRAEGEEHYLFTAIGLFTGMRLSEILGIRGCDIDYSTSTIRVEGKGKFQKKVRYCEVPPDLMRIIQSKNPGHHDTLVTGVSKWSWKRVVDRVGLNRDVKNGDRINSVSAHTLRHTYGSWLAAKGTPITVIKELMGHTDISTTMRYLKNAPRAGAVYAARLTEGVPLE